MNIIYGSIVIFLALLPGIVYRKSYLASEFSRRLISEKVFDDIIWAIIPGVILHSAAFFIIPKISYYEFNLKLIGRFLSANNDNQVISSVCGNIQQYYKEIVLYYVSICIIAFYGGQFMRNLVRLLKWDIKFTQLRGTNKWYYILSGESLMFPKQKLIDDISEKDLTIVDVLSKTSDDTNILYKGVLYNYYLKNDGGLEAIVLSSPRRRPLFNSVSNDGNNVEEDGYTHIPSTKFIIPFDNIENINLRQIQLIENCEDTTGEI